MYRNNPNFRQPLNIPQTQRYQFTNRTKINPKTVEASLKSGKYGISYFSIKPRNKILIRFKVKIGFQESYINPKLEFTIGEKYFKSKHPTTYNYYFKKQNKELM